MESPRSAVRPLPERKARETRSPWRDCSALLVNGWGDLLAPLPRRSPEEPLRGLNACFDRVDEALTATRHAPAPVSGDLPGAVGPHAARGSTPSLASAVRSAAWAFSRTERSTKIGASVRKARAIASLGPRWTFRVLVVPGAPLVAHGPYAWMRHPNYVGVMGELAGLALLAGAPATGPLSIALFALLLRRRIAVEEAALKRQSFTRSDR